MRILIISLVIILARCSSKPDTMFTLLPAAESGLDFVNILDVHDTLNILDNEFVYNGGGVAVGDLNNDELQDVFFTGNQSGNKLYLNSGGLTFKDISHVAGIEKKANQWSAGVTMIDINRDGKLDIYVCNTLSPIRELNRNSLFINQGNTQEGIPIFKDMAKEYGLDDDGQDSASAFFDYDNDGDIDVFLAINFVDRQYPNQYVTRTTDGSAVTRDKLFRNDWSETLNHPVFTDVSLESGIVYDGYSHSLIANDFNHDGWQDVYVCNDYISNDLLYINNGNGTFTNKIREYMKHFSLSAMGSDIGDINNDGLVDMMVTEMMPYENMRKKLFLSANNYSTYLFTEQFNYEYQYTRNTLQLNRGSVPGTTVQAFSDISFFSGLQETDWSWTVLMADWDNDGWRDITVTNGFPRDVTDHDFGAFRSGPGSSLVSKAKLYQMIPEIKVPNFMLRNMGDLTFQDVSQQWGITRPSFSNGAAYVDLDNDGDLDLLVNNINDYAYVYRNNLNNPKNKLKANYVRIELIGSELNPDAIGAIVKLYSSDTIQFGSVHSGRGYLSKSENIIHFGMGKKNKVDSIEINWPDNTRSSIFAININSVNKVNYQESSKKKVNKVLSVGLLKTINPLNLGLDYKHEENDYIDFNIQRTLPHKFSQYGPGLAVGDINGDGLDDVVIGGSSRFNETIYLQTSQGKFIKKSVSLKPNYNSKEEDLGILLFDADNDGDNDLYIARGSYQHDEGSVYYQHMLGVNDGSGQFTMDTLAINSLRTCGSTVKAADFDLDGDLDLFIGGRVLPKKYPLSDKSFLLRNDSKKKDRPQFTDVTSQYFNEAHNLGLVSDALWSDFNNDNLPDLILACEWKPLMFYRNTGNGFINVTNASGISSHVGWWTSLAGADFDNDGDIDYVAGNYGSNTYFNCSPSEPITIYAKDFDNNGLYDPFISCFIRDSTGIKHEYFYHTRDDMIKQLVQIRQKFQTYGQFGRSTVTQVFSPEELKGAQIMRANYMMTSYIENLGNDRFKITALPSEAQLAPVFGMMPYDYDQDGFTDMLMIGNDYGMELLQGRADAFYGLMLKNIDGKYFKSITLDKSHFFIPKDARSLSRFSIGSKVEYIIASQNRDSLKVFENTINNGKFIPLNTNEIKAQIMFNNGDKKAQEFYWGSSFLSQEPRYFQWEKSFKEVTLFNQKGNVTRKIPKN